CLREGLERSAADLDRHLPVARLREDSSRGRVVARDDPRQRDAERSEVLARKRRRQLGVVDTRREAALRLEEVEVDRVWSGPGRLDDVVQLQRAEWDGVGRVLGG